MNHQQHSEIFSIYEFCKAYQISRAFLYSLWKNGNGPKYFYVGTRRFISREAAHKWVRKLEETSDV